MFPGAILVAILSPISGFIMDRIGAFKPIITGVLITFLGLLMMVIMFYQGFGYPTVILDILIMMGVGIAASNIISTTLSKLSDEEFVDGNSILNTFQQFSGVNFRQQLSNIIPIKLKTVLIFRLNRSSNLYHRFHCTFSQQNIRIVSPLYPLYFYLPFCSPPPLPLHAAYLFFSKAAGQKRPSLYFDSNTFALPSEPKSITFLSKVARPSTSVGRPTPVNTAKVT